MKKLQCVSVISMIAVIFLSFNVSFAVSEKDKSELALVDALIEQSRILKESNDSTWIARAKEAKLKVKVLYMSNVNNPDYWLIYAKYSALEGKERHIDGGLKKAFYFRPGYIEAFIAKGDIYFHLAKIADPYETVEDESIFAGINETYVRHTKAMEAKSAYEAALKSEDIPDEKKAEVYYKQGELEMQMLKNREEAVSYWMKSISASPESKWGKLSKERFNTYK